VLAGRIWRVLDPVLVPVDILRTLTRGYFNELVRDASNWVLMHRSVWPGARVSWDNGHRIGLAAYWKW